MEFIESIAGSRRVDEAAGSEPLAHRLGTLMGNGSCLTRSELPTMESSRHLNIGSIGSLDPHNSSELLAEQIGKVLRIRVDRSRLVRVRATAKQGTLLRHQRRATWRGLPRFASVQNCRQTLVGRRRYRDIRLNRRRDGIGVASRRRGNGRRRMPARGIGMSR